MTELTKVTVNLPTKLLSELKKQASRRNMSMTDTIRRGLEMDLYLSNAENEGSKILLEKNDKQIVQVIRKY